MDIIPLPSGRNLTVRIAAFSVANKLRKVVASEFRAVQMDVDPGKVSFDTDLAKLSGKELNTFKNVVCSLLASDAVENAFWECAKVCTIDEDGNNVKVTKGDERIPCSFESQENRADFVVVGWEVMRINCAPFFAGLGFVFSTTSVQKTDAPASS